MALIVEDGTIVTGADSYVSRADAITYAANRGVTLANTDATDIIIRKACDYVESFAARFKGTQVERDQPLSWPREGANIEGWDWGGDEIPRQVIAAQLAVIIEVNAGVDPYNPTPVAGQVTEKTVHGAVTVKYAAGSAGSQKVSKGRESMTLINLLLNRNGLTAVRA